MLMKRVFKWIGIAILVPIALFIIFTLLLYFPPVQNWAVKEVASYASESTGMDISVEHVDLSFWLDLNVDGVKVIQQNDSLPQVKDTVADIKKMVVDIQMLPLFQKKVMVDQLDFQKMKVNTTNFVHQARVKGNIGLLSLKAHGIDLGKQLVQVDDVLLSDAKVSVELSDTVPPDTTPSTNFWKINVRHLNVRKADFTVHTPGDTLQIGMHMEKTLAQNCYFDLYKGLYSIEKFNWSQGRLKYDNRYKVHTSGLDPNHIELDSIDLAVSSFYYCDPRVTFKLDKCNFREKSGIVINQLVGPFSMDSTKLSLPKLCMKTPESSLLATVDMDLNAFSDSVPGKIMATLHGSFGKQDLMRFMGAAPVTLRRLWPNYPLAIDGSLKGNLNYISFSGLTVKLPTAFDIHANGWLDHPMDMNKLRANINMDAHTYNLNFVTAMLDPQLMKQIRVPNGIGAKGNVQVEGQR